MRHLNEEMAAVNKAAMRIASTGAAIVTPKMGSKDGVAYAKLPLAIFNDSALDSDAIAALTYVLATYPSNAKIGSLPKVLMHRFGYKKAKARKATNALIDAGYVVRTREKNADGTYGSVATFVTGQANEELREVAKARPAGLGRARAFIPFDTITFRGYGKNAVYGVRMEPAPGTAGKTENIKRKELHPKTLENLLDYDPAVQFSTPEPKSKNRTSTDTRTSASTGKEPTKGPRKVRAPGSLFSLETTTAPDTTGTGQPGSPDIPAPEAPENTSTGQPGSPDTTGKPETNNPVPRKTSSSRQVRINWYHTDLAYHHPRESRYTIYELLLDHLAAGTALDGLPERYDDREQVLEFFRTSPVMEAYRRICEYPVAWDKRLARRAFRRLRRGSVTPEQITALFHAMFIADKGPEHRRHAWAAAEALQAEHLPTVTRFEKDGTVTSVSWNVQITRLHGEAVEEFLAVKEEVLQEVQGVDYLSFEALHQHLEYGDYTVRCREDVDQRRSGLTAFMSAAAFSHAGSTLHTSLHAPDFEAWFRAKLRHNPIECALASKWLPCMKEDAGDRLLSVGAFHKNWPTVVADTLAFLRKMPRLLEIAAEEREATIGFLADKATCDLARGDRFIEWCADPGLPDDMEEVVNLLMEVAERADTAAEGASGFSVMLASLAQTKVPKRLGFIGSGRYDFSLGGGDVNGNFAEDDDFNEDPAGDDAWGMPEIGVAL